jgi:Cytochrome bd terminal oxidase subunit I
MHLDPVILSRVQFGFVVSFHIIFPAFTIGLAAWLATIEGMRLATGDPVYRRVFDFWLKVFALSFGMGVVSGIVMAFQFGTNWSVLAERTGPIQGPLLGYEGFTAFMLEATFFGVMLLGATAARPGSTFSRAAWSPSARCCRRSGSSATTAGCRCRSDTRWSTASWYPLTGGRSPPDPSCGCAGRTFAIDRFDRTKGLGKRGKHGFTGSVEFDTSGDPIKQPTSSHLLKLLAAGAAGEERPRDVDHMRRALALVE